MIRTALVLLGLLTAPVASSPTAWQSKAGAGDCVTIGKPKPGAVYVYEHAESTGRKVQNTQQWESLTDKGFRMKAVGSKGPELVVNEHRIVDDVAVIDKSSKLGPGGAVLESTTFRPGLVADPAFRACAGRSWNIDSVSASYQSRAASHSAPTPAGTLRIVSIRERITVPAGTFETVRYIRTSQSTDEYWKSIEHGVIVKHIGRLPMGTVTETLVAIK